MSQPRRIDAFLELAVKQGGSDLHLVVNEPPRVRLHGVLHRVRFRDLTAEDMDRLVGEVMDEETRERFQRDHSVDLSYESPDLGRFRVNVYTHVDGLAAAFRLVPSTLRPLEEMGLPDAVQEVLLRPGGLTLVTGPAGSGKSTTLASMVDFLNRKRAGHVITVEEPIEFRHQHVEGIVTQRQIGRHTVSYPSALEAALREDPDTVLVGEMRDPETIALALSATETGVQVLGCLHTVGAVGAVERIVNAFPAGRQEQIRAMLADGLRLILSQQLVRLSEGQGRMLVAETLVNTQAVETMIRSGRTHQLESTMQSGARVGMQSLDQELRRLVEAGTITGDDACHHALDPSKFQRFRSREVA
jgi:twitching motility protein PilT